MNAMYKTIVNGKEVTGTYSELTKLVQGFIGHPFVRI
jgi:hypothetical protein